MTTTLRNIMLISSLALVGWGSAAAQDDPALNTSTDGYNFSLDWLSKTMPEPSDFHIQGFGQNNEFFIKGCVEGDEGLQRIVVYNEDGYDRQLAIPTGGGSNFTKDEAGNFIVRMGEYTAQTYESENEIRVIKSDGSVYYDISLPLESCPSGDGDYWGFAEGDVTSAQGGKLFIASAGADFIYVVEIKSGQLVEAYNVDLPFLFGPNHELDFSWDDYISTWLDANGRRHYLVVKRSENPIDITLDGRTASGKEIQISSYNRYGTSNGANCFVMNGKNYIMFSISPNWGDGFVIAELGTDANGNLDGSVNVVAKHELSYSFDNDNTLFCNWLNVEPRDDKSVYVYQYYPNYEGGYMARYIFSADSDDTPLEWIVNEGTVGESYTVADDIWGIYIAEKEPTKVYAKDLGRHRKPSKKEDGWIDYVRQWAGLQTSAWDQSNWVLLEFASEDEAKKFAAKVGGDFSNTTAKVIKGGTLTGILTDKLNPTMQVTSYQEPTTEETYTENYYITCNFMTPNVQNSPVTDYDKPFFFVEPKAQEFVKVNWATYDGETSFHFSVPETGNAAQLKGGFKVNWDLYPGNYKEEFGEGISYNFHAIVRYDNPASTHGSRAEGDPQEGAYTVYPLEGGKDVITGIDRVSDNAEVQDVSYVNLMGMRSSKPFAGINLVVTRYSNGTVTTTKSIY